MDIQARKRNKAFVCSACALLAFVFSLVSCENFNKPVRAYFDYYTNTAGIEEISVPESIGTWNGMKVIESNSDKEIFFYLRNGKNFPLSFEFITNTEDCAAVEFSPELTDNRSIAKKTFAKSFLEDLELAGGPKNISGTITVTPADGTPRDFPSCPFSILVNSVPPRVKNSVIARDASNFVVCFRIKNLSGTVHEKDTKDIYINGEHYILNFSPSSVSITDGEGNTDNLKLKNSISQLFKLTAQDFTSSASDEDKFTYENPESGYLNLYYVTGTNPDAAGNNRTFTYTITLKDMYGFSSEAAVSTTSEKLTPPNVEVTSSGTDYCTDDKTGKYELVISHDNKCFHNTPEGQTVESTMSSSPSIIYEVYDNNENLVLSGTKKAPVKIPLARGKYYVKSYAVHPGCVDSENSQNCAVKDNAFTVRRSRNYYVNATGSADNNGSYDYPYRTIMQCVHAIEDVAQTEGDDGTYKIILQSDIPADDANTSTYLVEIPYSRITIQHFYIEGNGHTIYDTPARAVTIHKVGDNTRLTINNLNISQGRVYLESGILEYLSGTISGCEYSEDIPATHTNVIGARTGTLYLGSDDGMVTITGNSLKSGSHAVDVDWNAECHIRKAVIYDNKIKDTQTQSNLYIKNQIASSDTEVLVIDGDLTGSKIGIQTQNQPATGSFVKFTSGYGYNGGYNNGVPPGRYFIGDVYGVGFDSATGEACLAQNGGGFDVQIEENIKISIDNMYIPFHTEKTINCSVTRYNQDGTTTDITDDCRNFNFCFSYYGQDMYPTYYDKNAKSVTIKNNLRSGAYSLFVTADYNGVTYSSEFPIEVRTVNEVWVSSTGNDSYTGADSAHPLGSFTKAVQMINDSNSTNFFIMHISGTVPAGTSQNIIEHNLAGLTIDGGNSGAVVTGDNTVLNVKQGINVTVSNVQFNISGNNDAIKMSKGTAKLIATGNTKLGKVYLDSGVTIFADSQLSGSGTVATINPKLNTLNTQVLTGTSSKYNRFIMTDPHRGINSYGKIIYDYEFIATAANPLPTDLSPSDIYQLMSNGGVAKNAVTVNDNGSIWNNFAISGTPYDQLRWARMIGTTMCFMTKDGNYGVMTIVKVERINSMCHVTFKVRFGNSQGNYTAGTVYTSSPMTSNNSDIDSLFSGNGGNAANDIHTTDGTAIHGAKFKILHYGNKNIPASQADSRWEL